MVPLHPGEANREALQFIAESEVSYVVPAGQDWFSGMIFYQSQATAYAPVLIRIRADNELLWERGMDGAGPAISFSVPVIAGSRLIIQSQSTSVTSFYLVNPQFSAAEPHQSPMFQLAPGQGYVDAAPLPRQAVLGIFQPGESVPLSSYFAGPAAKATIDVHVRPEWSESGATASTTHIDVPLQSGPGGLRQGTTTWIAPNLMGPARLHVKETVLGRVVFERELRVAIGRRVDLSAISDGYFGVHLSGAGYPLIFDEFAGLWGAKWGRLFVRWPVVEPSPGKYEFSRIDALINSYRSQDMRILLVLGENAPAWAGDPGPAYYAAWKRFVNSTVRHLAGRVDAWEIFNEVDAKYHDGHRRSERDWDVRALRIAIDGVRDNDPGSPTVCCSTVTPWWLTYDRRIFQSGLLKGVDIVSLHPYQQGAPEMKDGEFDYGGRLHNLRDLVQSFGRPKPIWATEANWIIGPKSAPTVSEPWLTEQNQAEFVVRANLLSAANKVKFFLHSPYAHPYRTQIHLSTWAAYSQMTSFFSGARPMQLALSGPQVFGVSAESDMGQVGALWTAYKQSAVRLEGGRSYRFFDMYGNPLPRIQPESVTVSTAPLYYVTSRPAHVEVVTAARLPQWKNLPGFSDWTCGEQSTCSPALGGRHVRSRASTGAFQLVSAANNSSSGSCYMARVRLAVEQGTVGFYAVNTATSKPLDHVVLAGHRDGPPRTVVLRFHTGTSRDFKLVLANANLTASVSAFRAFDHPEITECP